MPIKDLLKRRAYFKNYMTKKRKGLTVKPEPGLLNPIEKVKPVKPSHQPNQTDPRLTRLIKEWQTSTNYSCSPGCNQGKYCSNCWYFAEEKLINYKTKRAESG